MTRFKQNLGPSTYLQPKVYEDELFALILGHMEGLILTILQSNLFDLLIENWIFVIALVRVE